MSECRPQNARRYGAAIFAVSFFVIQLTLGLALVDSSPARAALFDALGIDTNSLVSTDVIKSLVSFVGFGTQHRPYEPATPLGLSVGLDFSVEVTLFKVPDSLFQSLSAFGAPATSPLPSFPITKLHLHKGFGDFLDGGVSALYVSKSLFVGTDVKLTLVQGEEGPTYSVRFCYSYANLSFSGIDLTAHTYSPQIIASRQMEFADPYVGFGLEYATGSVKGNLKVPVDPTTLPPGVTEDDIPAIPYQSPKVSAFGAMLFGGVSLKVPRSGLRLTMEGSYNTGGESSMGTKVGFTF